ncbi:MAG: DMT family transporter, partial [Pseudomonadota bacterium]
MSPLSAIASLLTFGCCVAIIIAVGKVLVGDGGWSPLVLLGIQNTAAGLLVFFVCIFRPIPWQRIAAAWRYFLISAAAGIGFPQAISFLVAPHLGAAMTSIIYLFPPLLTFVFALGLKVERLDLLGCVSIGLGIIGGVLIFYGQGFLGSALLGSAAATHWLAIAFLAPLAQAGGNIYRSKYWPQDIPLLPFAAMILVLSDHLERHAESRALEEEHVQDYQHDGAD